MGDLNSFNCTNRDIVSYKSIPILSPPFGIIFYQNMEMSEMIIRSLMNRNSLDILITDENNIIIDFNNLNWSMAFEIKNYKRYKQNIKRGISLEINSDSSSLETETETDNNNNNNNNNK